MIKPIKKSDLVNDAVRYQIEKDEKDLADIKKISKEPTIPFEKVLKNLKIRHV